MIFDIAKLNELLNIYGGVNVYFKLFSEYIEQINDDDLKKRDLESLKRKNDNYTDHIGQNYYSILFNKETVILIVNGDKGNEGTIELTNKEIEKVEQIEKIFDDFINKKRQISIKIKIITCFNKYYWI